MDNTILQNFYDSFSSFRGDFVQYARFCGLCFGLIFGLLYWRDL